MIKTLYKLEFFNLIALEGPALEFLSENQEEICQKNRLSRRYLTRLALYPNVLRSEFYENLKSKVCTLIYHSIEKEMDWDLSLVSQCLKNGEQPEAMSRHLQELCNSTFSYLEHKLLYYSLSHDYYTRINTKYSSENPRRLSFDEFMTYIYDEVKNVKSDLLLKNNENVEEIIEKSLRVIDELALTKESPSVFKIEKVQKEGKSESSNEASQRVSSKVFPFNYKMKEQMSKSNMDISKIRRYCMVQSTLDQQNSIMIQNIAPERINPDRKFNIYKDHGDKRRTDIEALLTMEVPVKYHNFLFTKRENIDKYVIRKFRKFLKFKNDHHEIDTADEFCRDFININLLPPFEHNGVKFNSFNTAYMIWIFSHEAISRLYSWFVEETLESFIIYYNNKFKLTSKELITLRDYILKLDQIFVCEALKQKEHEDLKSSESINSVENIEKI